MIESRIPLIQAHHVSVRVSQDVLLNPTSFEIYENDKVAICGPNGSGKTTLIRCLVQLQKFSGQIKTKAQLKIGYLPQVDLVDKQIPFSVHRFLKIYCQNSKQEKSIDLWIEKLNAKDLLRKQINELSRGEFQKILLIRSLLQNPELLVLDEPFACLDQKNIQLITEILLHHEKLAVLISVHDPDWIKANLFRKLALNKESSTQYV
jgi:ABC-type Mn2+/Zn2+ transport system ATPase subunit